MMVQYEKCGRGLATASINLAMSWLRLAEQFMPSELQGLVLQQMWWSALLQPTALGNGRETSVQIMSPRVVSMPILKDLPCGLVQPIKRLQIPECCCFRSIQRQVQPSRIRKYLATGMSTSQQPHPFRLEISSLDQKGAFWLSVSIMLLEYTTIS